tara:strand:+ start:1685 stop:2365 length:681 start_codon:yes stop_codon:yes gene_type:complete
MKKLLYPLLLLILITSCTSPKNTEAFINATSGRYLFNANEILEIYFEDAEMHAKWRGNDDIALLKINDSSFYMKELNEKMLFVSKPEMHIELAPKTEHKDIIYNFKKLKPDEKTPNEYFKAKEYDKALVAFKEIQAKDSLNATVREWSLNRLGYDFIQKNDFDAALEIFKINAELYPKSSNVFNSLGEAYYLKKDTINAILNFKKSLAINPENRNSKRFIEKLNQE